MKESGAPSRSLMFPPLLFAVGIHLGCAHGASTASPASHGVGSVEARLEAAIGRYSALVLDMNHSAIAALFAPDGEIVNPGQAPVRGRASIESFLASFAAYQVLENATVPSNTVVHRDSAVQLGTYHQRVRTPTGQVVEVSGQFKAEWVRNRSGDWLIQRMGTTPSP